MVGIGGNRTAYEPNWAQLMSPKCAQIGFSTVLLSDHKIKNFSIITIRIGFCPQTMRSYLCLKIWFNANWSQILFKKIISNKIKYELISISGFQTTNSIPLMAGMCWSLFDQRPVSAQFQSLLSGIAAEPWPELSRCAHTCCQINDPAPHRTPHHNTA